MFRRTRMTRLIQLTPIWEVNITIYAFPHHHDDVKNKELIVDMDQSKSISLIQLTNLMYHVWSNQWEPCGLRCHRPSVFSFQN
jgi:hypothetical protein